MLVSFSLVEHAAEGTMNNVVAVIRSYVVRALQADPSLPYSMNRLKAFVQLEAGSWQRHRQWILEQDGYGK